MKKRSQDYTALANTPQLRGKTLADLYMAIRADVGLAPAGKAQLIGQIKGLTGQASDGTTLSSLMLRGLGGSIGWLISKYFGMGPVGQLVSAVAGYGLGSAINNQLNRPPKPHPGWRML
jgi:hypothetical protein